MQEQSSTTKFREKQQIQIDLSIKLLVAFTNPEAKFDQNIHSGSRTSILGPGTFNSGFGGV